MSEPSILTHNGIWTVKSLKTGEHRTFLIKTQPKDSTFAPGKRVVALLSGSDNTTDYTSFGFVVDGKINVWNKRRGSIYDSYARMLEQLAAHVANGNVEVLAATTCRVCNHKLTTPESIEAGIGPICANS